MSNTKKNFIYNLIYQVLILIIPLITAPYLSRVVGATGVGTYSYTYSIVYYFMLLTLLGVNNYGNRSVAKIREDKEKLSKTFWSIYFFQLAMGITMLIVYIGYVAFFDNQHKLVAIIQALYIVSAIFDINWLYFGLEEFKVTITRNTLVKLGSIVLIFVFVKKPDDLWKYTLIVSGMTVLSQVLLWTLVRKRVNFVKVKWKEIKEHIKPNLMLFIPVIAISLYKIMDKIMLGAISNVREVGFYENAEKIVNIPVAIISVLGTVMLPKMSNIIGAKENNKAANEYISKSMSFVMFMAYAICFGLITIGYHFAPLYFGNEFQKTGVLIMLLSTTLPFLSFANVLRTQYLIPSEKDKVYIISVSMGAAINLILNFLLIPKFESIGACFGTIAAEIVVMSYQTIAVRKKLEVKKYIKNTLVFLLKAIIMFAIVYPLNFWDADPFKRIVLQVLIGVAVYLLLNIKYVFTIIRVKNKI